jgi:hypothetical protein
MVNLDSLDLNINDLTYRLYYLVLNEGVGESPIKVDSAFVSYKGTLFDNTIFDQADAPVWFRLDEVIPGWGELIPLFKAGNSTEKADGTVDYTNFGAGVMFLPSSFAYYSSSVGVIPSYSPLIFNFKLINQKHRDHDGDEVLSIYEYYDVDLNIMDTDGDGTPNFFDLDDDGDGHLTKTEIKKPSGELGLSLYYPFNPIVDDPNTSIDETETKGIPRKFTGPNGVSGLPTPLPSDYTDVNRLRRHLDPTAKPPYQ